MAIIGVLAAISIPIFTGQLEKSRRAVDLSNARNIESTVMYYWMDGELNLDEDQACYVFVTRNKNSEFKVTPGSSADAVTSAEFQKLVTGTGIVSSSLRVKSRDTSNGGWYCFYLFGNGEHGFVSSTNPAVTEGVFMSNPSVTGLRTIISNNAKAGGLNMQNAINGSSD